MWPGKAREITHEILDYGTSKNSIGVEGKQQKKSKNYTKNALRVADNAMIEGACIHREARRWSNVEGEEEEKISGKQK